jgi:UDP:flavonoid glycosyltransferase YjiC (YdhE family)
MLFTCRPGYGHYYPLVPLARAAVAAGHAVAVAAGEPIRAAAEADGFEAFGAGLSFACCREAMAARIPDFAAIPPEQHRSVFFGQVFTNIELPARLPDLLAIAGKWQPDVLVHDLSEFAGPLAAELTGIPYATCGYGPLPEPETADIAAAGAAPHWAAAGLEPSAGRLYRSLYLDPCPPSLQVPAIATVPHRVPVRPEHAEAAAGDSSPDWLDSLPARPTVHLSFGTIWNQDLSVFHTVLDALAARPVNVIVALGPGRDPAALGSQPANVHVRSFIPYAQLLGHCDLVVCHGGAGSVLGALTDGLPLLVLPQAADQFYNAARVVAAGAGLCLRRADLTARAVDRAVDQLLDDVSYRDAARSIAAEIAAMPTASSAVSAIAALVHRAPG